MASSRGRETKCDYSSEFSDLESEADTERPVLAYQRKDELLTKTSTGKMGLFNSSGSSSFKKPPSKRVFDAELDRQEGKRMRYHGILAMDAYARHQKFVNDYLTYYGGKREDFKIPAQTYLTDKDIIKQNNKFLWDETDVGGLSWEQKLAKKYWDKLFKEYAIADLSHFKENKIALRWCIEKEVINGKGQFKCGNKHCNEKDGLRSWEVNFAYVEDGEKKNTLVKLRLCPECSYKLNYHHKKREIKRKKKKKKVKDDEGIGQSNNTKSDHKKSYQEATTSKSDRVGDNDMLEEEKIWSQPPKVDQEMSRDDEFDKFFNDMFP